MLFYIASFLNKDTKCNQQAPLKVIITDTASVFTKNAQEKQVLSSLYGIVTQKFNSCMILF